MTDTTPHGSTPGPQDDPALRPSAHRPSTHGRAATGPGPSRTGSAVDAALAADLSSFVMRSPSSYHAAYAVRERLVDHGFEELDEGDRWSLEPGGRYVVVRDGAVIAFAVPDPATAPDATPASSEASAPRSAADPALASVPFHVVGAHTDSPGFKLKPQPDFVAEGALQVGVEIYGGPLLNSWLDRELCFAGRLVLRDGATVLAQTGPIARIPQLAIHLDRKANEGLTLDRQRHTQPVIGLADMVEAGGLGDTDAAGSHVLGLLAESAGVDLADVDGFDVLTFPVQEPAVFGAHSEFLASPRLDNLASVWAGTSALEDVDPTQLTGIAVLAAFDHEEVGSETRSGASGPFLDVVLERVTTGLGGQRDDHLQALSASVCVSSDAGHAVHPNYPGHHDPVNRPRLGGGPLLKINAQQRYSTDAVGTAVWARACRDAGVGFQEFVSNNTIPCGSTIGPLTATRLGMTTVDVGPALWSMHSAREMCAVSDLADLRAALGAYFAG
ncbi:MAG: M18 family aminopeptidase [Brevibacterium yomogidense]